MQEAIRAMPPLSSTPWAPSKPPSSPAPSSRAMRLALPRTSPRAAASTTGASTCAETRGCRPGVSYDRPDSPAAPALLRFRVLLSLLRSSCSASWEAKADTYTFQQLHHRQRRLRAHREPVLYPLDVPFDALLLLDHDLVRAEHMRGWWHLGVLDGDARDGVVLAELFDGARVTALARIDGHDVEHGCALLPVAGEADADRHGWGW